MTLVLSRYACLRRDGDRLVAEGRDPVRPVPVDDPRTVRLLQLLAGPCPLAEAASAAGLSEADARRLVEPLIEAGVVVAAATASREDASLWAFDDVRVHARTRRSGLGPFPPAGAPEPPPALVGARWPDTVALPRPDIDARERDDPPLAAVQARRRSVREPGPRPLPLADLGELLFRVGRVEDVGPVGPTMGAFRPYPSAGALYELELYVVAGDCAQLAHGLYHYVAEHHVLARAPGSAAAALELLDAAAAGMGVAHRPQAGIVVAARFPRIAFKYGPLAYSLMLKDVGVLLQTLYLAATAMHLGACAVGTGDAAAFARASGLDPEEETSVGELCLVTR